MSENKMQTRLNAWVKTNFETFSTINQQLSPLIFTAGTSQTAWSRLHNLFYEARWEHYLNIPDGITEQQAIKGLPDAVQAATPPPEPLRAQDRLRLYIERKRHPDYGPCAIVGLRRWVNDNADLLGEFYGSHDPNVSDYRRAFWIHLEDNALHLPPNVSFDYALNGFGYLLWEIERYRVAQFDKKAA